MRRALRHGAWLVALCLPLAAALAGKPDSAETLKETEEALQHEQAREQELAAETDRIEAELRGLRGELVKLAEAVRRNERELLDAEDKLAILDRQVQERSAQLKARQDELAAMVQASVRLSRTPPEAAMMMPGEFAGALKSARVLASLSEAIRRESESIGAQVAELEALKGRVLAQRERIEADRQTLQEQQRALDGRVEERQRLSAQLLKEQKDVRRRVGDLTRRAKDLKELLTALEKGRQEQQARERAQAPRGEKLPAGQGKLRSFLGAKGRIAMPVAGRIARRYGEPVGRNETSKGMLIRARSRARVSATYDGEVVFTGPFLAYGNIVILRHADDFHMLLAGISDIDVAVGQFLLEGEPIGAMGENPPGTDLYVELRQRNQPIDPASWFRGVDR